MWKIEVKEGSVGWYWQIFSDDTLRSARQKQIRRCSTFFAKQLCNQSCLEHSSAEPGALCAFFLQHQFVLAFILLFCLSKLWHAKAVSCQLDHTSDVNAFAYFQPVCLSQSAFFDVSFWKYSTFPHVISSQWFQSEHFPNYFHPHNHISIPVSAFPCPAAALSETLFSNIITLRTPTSSTGCKHRVLPRCRCVTTINPGSERAKRWLVPNNVKWKHHERSMAWTWCTQQCQTVAPLN